MTKLKFLRTKRKVSRSYLGTVALVIVLLAFAVVIALPLALIISNSFKSADELWVFPPKLIPNNPTMENFRNMFNVMSEGTVPFARYLFNSVFITTVGTAGNIIFSSMCSFVLAKYKFPGSKLIFRVIVVALMFNATVTAIPNYLVLSYLGWIDTYAALIIPAFGSSLGLYLMKQFMEQLPDSLIEAARIDGANLWMIFWKVIMPNVKSAWMTLLLLSVQQLWGTGATTYIYKEQLKTLPYALNQILTGGIARAGVGAAVSVLMMIVPVVIFVFSQSNIIETMSSSGLKD